MPSTISSRKFGVEIEGFGLTDRQIESVISNELGLQTGDWGSHRDGCWEIKEDGSVSGDNPFEVASPPLSGEDGLRQVREVVSALARAGAQVNRTCGLHVHVDARDLKSVDLANVVIQYGRHESVFDAMMPVSRRNNDYCRSVRDVADTLRRNILTIAVNNNTSDVVEAYAWERYHKVNLAAYLTHGTIEFRQHSGSINHEKVTNWIQFCVNFVEQCIVPTTNITLTVEPPQAAPPYPMIRPTARFIPSPEARLLISLLNSSVNQPVSVETIVRQTGISESRVAAHIATLRRSFNIGISGLPHRGDTYFLRNLMLDISPPSITPAERVRLTDLQTPFVGLANEIVSFYQERTMELAVR